MDPATLAATIVGTYLMPYVAKGASSLAGAVANKLGDEAGKFAANVAGSLWSKVKSRFSAGGDKYTIDEFEQHPEEQKQALERKLREKLEQDDGFRQELEALVSKAGPHGQTATQIIENSGVMVNLQQANFAHAHHFGITGAQYGAREPGPNPGAQPEAQDKELDGGHARSG